MSGNGMGALMQKIQSGATLKNIPARWDLPVQSKLHCQWIEGEPGYASWCSEPRSRGKPYCAAHCARAYYRRSNGQEMGP